MNLHYAPGFGSPLPRRYRYPHANGVVTRELEKRGFGEIHQQCQAWLDEELQIVANLSNVPLERLLRWATQHQKAWPALSLGGPPAETTTREMPSDAPQRISEEMLRSLLQEERGQSSLTAAIKVIAKRLHLKPGQIQWMIYEKKLNAFWKEMHISSKLKQELIDKPASSDLPNTSKRAEHAPLVAVFSENGKTASDLFFLRNQT